MKAPAYWQGGDIDIAAIGSEGYKKKSKERMTKLRRFLDSDELAISVIKACASSLARWRYVRELERGPYKPKTNQFGDDSSGSDTEFVHLSVPKKLRGVSRAQKGLLEEIRRIALGRDIISEFLINREDNHETIRLIMCKLGAEIIAYLVPSHTLEPSGQLLVHIFRKLAALTSNNTPHLTNPWFGEV